MAFVIGVRYGESDRDRNWKVFPREIWLKQTKLENQSFSEKNWSSHHLQLLQCMVTALLRVHWSGANSYINLSTSAKYFLSHNISLANTVHQCQIAEKVHEKYFSSSLRKLSGIFDVAHLSCICHKEGSQISATVKSQPIRWFTFSHYFVFTNQLAFQNIARIANAVQCHS